MYMKVHVNGSVILVIDRIGGNLYRYSIYRDNGTEYQSELHDLEKRESGYGFDTMLKAGVHSLSYNDLNS